MQLEVDCLEKQVLCFIDIYCCLYTYTKKKEINHNGSVNSVRQSILGRSCPYNYTRKLVLVIATTFWFSVYVYVYVC